MLFAGLPTVKQSSPLKIMLSSNSMFVPQAENPIDRPFKRPITQTVEYAYRRLGGKASSV